MTAKNPQNRDQTLEEAALTTARHPDRQEPGQNKVENDHNRLGEQEPTQKNEGRRTPDSRSDRTDHVGSGNQNQSRKGNAGSVGGGAGGDGRGAG